MDTEGPWVRLSTVLLSVTPSTVDDEAVEECAGTSRPINKGRTSTPATPGRRKNHVDPRLVETFVVAEVSRD